MSQALDLLFPPKSDEIFRYGPFRTTEEHPAIAQENAGSSDHERPFRHLIDASEELPERMAAQQVILAPGVKPFAQTLPVSRTHRPVMEVGLLGKSPGPPPFGSCTQHSEQIDSARFDRAIPANRFKTISSKNLAGAGDVFDTGVLVVVTILIRSGIHKPSAD